MRRNLKKEIEDTKKDIQAATRILDLNKDLQNQERWYIIDVFIRVNNLIDKLKMR